MKPSSLLLADHSLSCRLERAEGDANRRFVEARARVEPQIGAAWIDVEGTYAMFDGVDSPLTQSFGLGLFSPPTAAQLDRIESFFFERGATVYHEVSPIAGGVTPLLHARGYEPFEFSSVMFQALDPDIVRRDADAPAAGHADATATSGLRVRRVDADELPLFTRVAADGWSEFPELRAFMLDFGRVTATAEGMWSFLAEIDGQPAATASLIMHEGVALMAGASTVPGARRRGAQAALLSARLLAAVNAGCDVAMMVAQAGSGSQRNAERSGFRIAYTRLKWRLPLPVTSPTS